MKGVVGSAFSGIVIGGGLSGMAVAELGGFAFLALPGGFTAFSIATLGIGTVVCSVIGLGYLLAKS